MKAWNEANPGRAKEAMSQVCLPCFLASFLPPFRLSFFSLVVHLDVDVLSRLDGPPVERCP